MIVKTAPVVPALRRLTLFENCLAVSLAFHGLLFLALGRGGISSPAPPSPVEIDLTQPFLGDGPAKLAAPKKLVLPKAPPAPAHLSAPVAVAVRLVPPPVQPPAELPLVGKQAAPVAPMPDAAPDGLQTKPAPLGGNVSGIGSVPTGGGVPDGTGLSPKPGGWGEGAADGEPGGTGTGGQVLAWPKLLNKDEVLAAARRLYPDAERRAGRQGTVKVALHIGADGTVSAADVMESAGAAFDSAAQKVAQIMRFSPALSRKGAPVAVKLPQKIFFQLTD